MKQCPLCEKHPEEDLSKQEGYKFFYCSCGAAEPGPIRSNAIDNWNNLAESRKTKLLIEIAKKLGIVVTDEDSMQTYKILIGEA